MGGAGRAGAGAPPGRRDPTRERRLQVAGPLDTSLPAALRTCAPPRVRPQRVRGRGRGGRTGGDAKGGAAAASRWLRRPGWTSVWPFKGRPRGGARPWWLRSLLPGPAGQGLSVELWQGKVPGPAQVSPARPHGPGHREPLPPDQRPLHACGAHGKSGFAVVRPTQLAAGCAWGSSSCPRPVSP